MKSFKISNSDLNNNNNNNKNLRKIQKLKEKISFKNKKFLFLI
jgi:hypothetical protein